MSKQKLSDVKSVPPERFRPSPRLNNQKKSSIGTNILSSSKKSDFSSQGASVEQLSITPSRKTSASTAKLKFNNLKDSSCISSSSNKDKSTLKSQATQSFACQTKTEKSVCKNKVVRPTSAVSSSHKNESVSIHSITKAANSVSSSKQSTVNSKSVSTNNKDTKTRPSSAPNRKSTKSTTNFVLKNATRPISSNKSSNRLVSSPKTAFNTSSPKQRLSTQQKPLQTSKKSSKRLPPTAVVSPIQDRSKTLSPDSMKNSVDDSNAKLKKPSLIDDLTPSEHGNQTVSFDKLSSIETSPKLTDSSDVEVAPENDEEVDSKMLEVGHYFKACELKQWVNWCDACGGVIVAMFGAALSCKKCNMLCHSKCALAVSLTCAADEEKQEKVGAKPVMEETTDESTLKEYNTIKRVISADEVQGRIDVFNQTVKGIHQMTLQEDGETFRGFVRVSMNLVRPVSVTEQTPHKGPGENHKASFYVDKGALKALHVTSETTAEQVVRTLLRKYNITDNPMKFALFEKQVKEEEHVILRKMLPRERPLLLRLLWGNSNSEREFLLQENESRDIEWEAFSVAELQMFIKILDKEERDYEMEIKRRYKNKAEDIKMAIDHQKRKS